MILSLRKLQLLSKRNVRNATFENRMEKIGILKDTEASRE